MTIETGSSEVAISRPFRRLKVSYVRKRHEDPKTGNTRRYTRHASLTINGDWLEQAGFPTGTIVNVAVMQGKLVIEQVKEERTG
ncbi:SymE family type I addiction module toxin [Citrobacter farmeri]|uniref:SymE family type I addiction module toxin n=1 Tax=Citrobacter farmeri TaxID=67824 RepID=UPI00189E0E64|nr:SymE family type I addiction module toxin [Citrobacter farmeri]EKU0081929.1 type I toxin-antitoxin system SymE family toxin [Citrobacter farmeri]MBJ9136023.1 type I toxin-antitoxin system SymE family toxin [Citrobacter farmeri]MDZ7529261.1 SymE family type I addiction module toxin [Citrobacter farmeri]HCD2001838.1 type I toxin-antitoxin system SymE family toxin [Citrobacter farmeri]